MDNREKALAEVAKRRGTVIHTSSLHGDRRSVKLMAVVDHYAMVRRPFAVPYVCPVSEIEFDPSSES